MERSAPPVVRLQLIIDRHAIHANRFGQTLKDSGGARVSRYSEGVQIVCVHGMGRTRYSMASIARHLRRQGHTVHLFGYRRRRPLDEAAQRLAAFLERRGLAAGGPELGFVAHSAGGVVLRYLACLRPEFRAGRSVALGSPITGSILAEQYAEHWWVQAACGPILASLHPEVVGALPPAPCELASIAGTAQTPLLPASYLLRPVAGERASDSTVLVEETRSDHLEDWIEVPVVHTLLPLSPQVHRLVSHYLAHGRFGVDAGDASRTSK